MRAAAIFGLGCSPQNLKPFQSDEHGQIDWHLGMPAAADRADIILLFGGDGTIHRHLAQLVELGVPVLIVPAGSGNDFARALGLRHIRDSLAAWRKFCGGNGNVHEVDLGTITPLEKASRTPDPRYFCCVAGVGLDGEISRLANRLPRWLRGHGGYALSLVPAISSLVPFKVKLQSTDSTDVALPWNLHEREKTLLAVFSNTPVYGGGMRVAPRARMDDGLFDICLIADIAKLKLLTVFPTVYFGRHLGMKEVEYFQSNRLRVETEHPMDVYADGEYVCRTPVEVAVRPKALKVLTL